MKLRKREVVLKRKNFLSSLILIFLLWGILAFLIFFIDPDSFGVVPVFFAVFFTATLFTLSIIFVNTRRGLIASTSLTIFMLLRYFGIGNILNLVLIIFLAIVIELTYTKNRLQR